MQKQAHINPMTTQNDLRELCQLQVGIINIEIFALLVYFHRNQTQSNAKDLVDFYGAILEYLNTI